MTVQQSKKRPLSRYLKDFKHTQTHCAHCAKILDRITLTRCGEIVSKTAIAQLDSLIDENSWQTERQSWAALCRFCGDLYSKEQQHYFDIIGFKEYLFEQTEMSHGTIREYVVRLRRLGNHLSSQNIPLPSSPVAYLDDSFDAWLPPTSTNNYRIALRKYGQFQTLNQNRDVHFQENKSTSDIY
ncbi:flagella biosynthesis regulatory protein FliZ [Buttiauxella selenatireducens]|uniref:Flagella biosynthesis regulatory protein FliZ n=1 Tax=Buttiauxella selenatireducens TaxID=3073902 RepID=A0ABY9SEU8_9ENTR|nr:flagella biosynthesis regulatory protein FliZ [Buttiauxella sp. R73]WMY76019.1 flagella biosynthesis regulatory protein FliZ [Buttiauxella sp. R73]